MAHIQSLASANKGAAKPHYVAVQIRAYPIFSHLPIVVAGIGAKTPTAGEEGVGHALSVLRKHRYAG